ncbi:hypothetical protein KKB55_12350, partial [Myxococcota bacterium]|nr:hypothetical protein [Myxococcota bacterium]
MTLRHQADRGDAVHGVHRQAARGDVERAIRGIINLKNPCFVCGSTATIIIADLIGCAVTVFAAVISAFAQRAITAAGALMVEEAAVVQREQSRVADTTTGVAAGARVAARARVTAGARVAARARVTAGARV